MVKRTDDRYKNSPYFYTMLQRPHRWVVEIQSILRQRELSGMPSCRVRAKLSRCGISGPGLERTGVFALRCSTSGGLPPCERSLVTGGSGGDRGHAAGHMLWGVGCFNRHWEELSNLRGIERVLYIFCPGSPHMQGEEFS